MMLVTQIINFLIMVLVLTKFLYKPILKTIDERRKKISEGLELSEKMKEKEEELLREREKVLDKARAEGQKILEELKAKAKKSGEEILAEAKSEALALKEKAQKDIEDERKKIWSSVSDEVLTLSMGMTKTVIGQLLDSKFQDEVIEKKLKALEKESLHVN